MSRVGHALCGDLVPLSGESGQALCGDLVPLSGESGQALSGDSGHAVCGLNLARDHAP